MEFDLFGLSVKDPTTRNVIVRSNSTDPLYTMRLPSSSHHHPLLLLLSPLLLPPSSLRLRGIVVWVILALTL
jgi:hypothetical protein